MAANDEMTEMLRGMAAAAGMDPDAYFAQMKAMGIDFSSPEMMAQMMGAQPTDEGEANEDDDMSLLADWLGVGDDAEENAACLEESKTLLSLYDGIDGKTVNNPEDDYKKQFQILLAGIIATMNDHNLDVLAAETEPEYIESVVSILEQGWDISNKSDAIETLEYLLTEGHTKKYRTLCEVPADPENSDYDEDFVQFFSGVYPPEAVRGWDLGRAANVVRWCVAVGYLDEPTGWAYMDRVCAAATKEFHSFSEYGKSYLFGGMFWSFSNDSADGINDYVPSVKEALDELLAPNGAWSKKPWIE